MEETAYSEFSDGDLMGRLANGEMDVLGELYLRHGTLVAGAVKATDPVSSRQDVEDLRQEVFLAVVDSAGKYRDAGKFRSWLYSVAVRTTRNRQRSRGTRNRLLRMHRDEPVAMSAPVASPEDGAALHLDVAQAFEMLPEVQRQALILFEHLGLSGEEVAEVMGAGKNTVWSHLRRARISVLSILNNGAGKEKDRKKQ